jgi:hypothetical protein
MSYTGQNPRFRSTILTDVGLASIGNPASGSHRIINRGGTLQVQDSTGLETAIGAGGTVDRITQVGHGFDEGDILYNTGSAYAKANANTSATAEALGMVSRVIDVDTFELTLEGKVTGLTGLTAGAVYFLSASTAGAITVTEPSTLGYVSLPIGVAISTTAFYVKSSRGAVVGSTNARTEIALANNATTNVQSVSAYQAGELTGWVEIDGTTDSKFYVAAPFAKNGAATDFNISPQYVGDTPPVGFSLTVTSGGLIQATLPSIAGYVSAKINFALNAPAVGATFPLSIDSTLVQFSTLKAKDSGGFIFQENGGTQIGSWSDAGALTVGPTSGTANHKFQSGSATELQIASGAGLNTYLRFLPTGAGRARIFSSNTNGLAFANSSDTTVGEFSEAGPWTFGPSAGLGTSASAYHKYIGSLVGLSGTPTITGNTAVQFGTNFYRDGAGTLKALVTASGVTLEEFLNTGSPTAQVWGLYSNTTAQTADTAVAGAFSTIASATAGGAFTFGPTAGATGSGHVMNVDRGADNALIIRNKTTSGTPYALLLHFTATAPNNAASYFLECADSSTTRLGIFNNGNVVNSNNSYGAISDVSLKENIVDATPKLADLMNVQVRNYNLKTDSIENKQIGVVAQELEQVFPGMVEVNKDGLKNVKYSVFVPMLIKAIQELSAKVTALENKGV